MIKRFLVLSLSLARTSIPSVPKSYSMLAKPIVEENVWDYPRPPALEKTSRHLKITWVSATGEETLIADTTEAYRVLETSHPPTYYLPPNSLHLPLTLTPKSSFCEWKGLASYHSLAIPSSTRVISNRIWSYERPTERFIPIKGYLSFYAASGAGGKPLGGGGEGWRCEVDGEVVVPQDGDFYGGWKHSGIVGKMKGGPGTFGW